MILGVTPLDNDPCPLSLVTSSLTNLRGGITLGEHDLLFVLTGSLSVPGIVSPSSGSNSSFCKMFKIYYTLVLIALTSIRFEAVHTSDIPSAQSTTK